MILIPAKRSQYKQMQKNNCFVCISTMIMPTTLPLINHFHKINNQIKINNFIYLHG